MLYYPRRRPGSFRSTPALAGASRRRGRLLFLSSALFGPGKALTDQTAPGLECDGMVPPSRVDIHHRARHLPPLKLAVRATIHKCLRSAADLLPNLRALTPLLAFCALPLLLRTVEKVYPSVELGVLGNKASNSLFASLASLSAEAILLTAEIYSSSFTITISVRMVRSANPFTSRLFIPPTPNYEVTNLDVQYHRYKQQYDGRSPRWQG